MNLTPKPPHVQPEPKVFLVGSIEENYRSLITCPHAGTIEAWSRTHNCDIILALTCRRWGCKWCGPRRAKRLAYRCDEADPNRFITLTVANDLHESPRAAYDATRRKLGDFNKLMRKELGGFEYMRVLETTAKGWPHYHLVARCGYIAQARISTIWATLTGAKIVDIRKIHKKQDVMKYVLKYLCKQTHVPWTTRRVSWSGKFFPKQEKNPDAKWKLEDKRRTAQHPATYAALAYPGQRLEQLTANAWKILDNDPTGYRRNQHYWAGVASGTTDRPSATS